MVTVIGTHEVKNATEWKKGFDAHEPVRAGAGIKVNGVYSAVDNPNHITISMEFPSTEVLDGFVNNPEMEKLMAEGGVIGKPEFKVLNKI